MEHTVNNEAKQTMSEENKIAMDPEHRRLRLVEIEDARLAASVTEMLMGTEVPPRRKFIYDNAVDAELDV